MYLAKSNTCSLPKKYSTNATITTSQKWLNGLNRTGTIPMRSASNGILEWNMHLLLE